MGTSKSSWKMELKDTFILTCAYQVSSRSQENVYYENLYMHFQFFSIKSTFKKSIYFISFSQHS